MEKVELQFWSIDPQKTEFRSIVLQKLEVDCRAPQGRVD